MKFYFFIALFALVACGGESVSSSETEDATAKMEVNSDLPKEEQLYKQVLAAHDEIMPKMADINRLKKELKALESVPAKGKADVDAAINLLENMDNQMSSWMDKLGGYSDMAALKAETDTETIISRLEREMEHGKFLKKQIEQMIKMGEHQMSLHGKQ
ncbi:MAG: hypothetical protein AAGG68_07910 [Bacteroidota bacterium]